MEVFKKYLDGLPRIGLDDLIRQLELEDKIYEIIGNSGDFGKFSVIRFTLISPNELEKIYGDPEKRDSVKGPNIRDFLLKYMREGRDELIEALNNSANPLLVRDEEKRKLGLQKGEKTIRYKFVKKDGTEYEVLT
jgi:hypothetical protein